MVETATVVGERVGEQLAAARRAQGLELDDIALRTRVPLRHLQLIEAGKSEGLPAIPYSAGFVRTYASAVGLDGAALSRQFRVELGQMPPSEAVERFEPADPTRVPTKLLALVALLLAVLVAGGYALWRGDSLFGGGADERARLAAGTVDAPAADVQGPVGGVPPAPAAPAPAAGPVVVTAVETAWVKIYEKDGATLFMGEMPAGQRFEVPATAANPMIWTGRPQAFQASVGGRPVGPLGDPERVIRDVSLARDALLARGTPAPAQTVAPAAPNPTPAP